MNVKRFWITVGALVIVLAFRVGEAGREADRLYEDAVRQHARSEPAERFALYARAAEEAERALQVRAALAQDLGIAVSRCGV